MKSKFDVLIDSDAFVGWLLPADAHADHATKQFLAFEQSSTAIVTTNWVIAETATVLSHRKGQDLARLFLSMMEEGKFPIIRIDERLEEEAFAVFKTQEKKGTSMTDCANVAVMQRFAISYIYSFDRFYKHQRLDFEVVSS
ncbi:MAG: type II toxin-antitoxin system VapC family toxin [Anaerolineae bacterium]|nr:type II toxin-antitoxin system VapC family toxin [Anaerolineae bacterium]